MPAPLSPAPTAYAPPALAAVPPADTPRAARFWDRIAAKYAARPVSDAATYAEKLEIQRRLLGPDMDVLEIGCGTGTTALALASGVRSYLATDISEAMIGIARAKQGAPGQLRFERAALDELSFHADSFDVVLAHSLLHLVEDRDAALDRIRMLVKPGGLLIASTACIGDSMPWLRYVLPLGHAIGRLPLVRVFSADQLAASLEGAGFTIRQRWLPKRRAALFTVAERTG
ncbi:hypothetical protein LNKW23_29190 [Paralimibaculum aggregatum]|uniref:Methyltransferase type 11 domain-containing protein n=1 Tax=Paralimibaculum aggregatum TaxID=3036245 RepID=A0ABQ6LRD8_9RHOB|nr:class I SAM-dependent methyltransferase [Limibaculum sp. NKW23]GMG83706.1 hypothetical protein LNKW23_29190 [Limibaculum sp. NKW23]